MARVATDLLTLVCYSQGRLLSTARLRRFFRRSLDVRASYLPYISRAINPADKNYKLAFETEEDDLFRELHGEDPL
eukprot:4209024-Pyramimonas_sp.AAC.1